jgi:hypothetical protein
MPSNGTLFDDDDDDDDDDDNHSSVADGDVALIIDDIKTEQDKVPTESVIVLKQIRRLSSVEATTATLPSPAPPPTLSNVIKIDDNNDKSKDVNK